MHHSNPCVSKGKLIAIHVFAGVAMAIGFGLIFGIFVMLLWNSIVPDVFNLKEITYWQAVGLVILFRLLLGSASCYRHGHQEDKKSKDIDQYYQNWWETEGKSAFQQYVDKSQQLK